MKQKITNIEAPLPSGNYSQAIKVGNFVFISGQLPLKNGEIINNNIYMACRQCLINISNICNKAYGTINDVVKMNVYYTDIRYSEVFDEIIPEFFLEPYPSRIRIGVNCISKKSSIEVEAIMYIKNENTDK